jgi:hypothetical protein
LLLVRQHRHVQSHFLNFLAQIASLAWAIEFAATCDY